jgi:Rad3-related DNA helicase
VKLEDYPASAWRQHQRDYAELVRAVATMPGEQRIGLEGPCGCGKSIGYLRPLFDPAVPPSVVLTTTRQHLHQLEETLERYWPGGSEDGDASTFFGESAQWVVLRGRDHYGCCKSPRPKDGEEPDPEAVWANVGQGCPLGPDCRYRQAVVAAGGAKVVVQCTIGALYRRRFWSQLPEPGPNASPEQHELHRARQSILNRQVCVLDEAHEYLRVKREFETQRLAFWPALLSRGLQDALAKARQKWGGYKASYVLLPRATGRGEPLREWLESEIRKQLEPATLQASLDAEERAKVGRGQPFNRTARELELKKQWGDRLALFEACAEDSDGKRPPHFDPVLYLQWDGLKVQLISEPVFLSMKDKLAPKEIYTSATLKGVASLLGIDTKEWLHCFPAIFPAEHLMPEPLQDNANGSQKNEPVDAETLEALYHQDGRPLTIVLYLSKKAAHDAARNISTAPGVFVQGLRASHEGDDEEMKLSEMVSHVKNAALQGAAPFLVCYGGWVGTDIPGDKWLVIGQAPKTPLAPYIEERFNRRLGGGWDDYEKITLDRLQLAQGIGRGQRTPEDRVVVIWPDNSAFRQLGMNRATGNIRT